jgi:hypothetical protein
MDAPTDDGASPADGAVLLSALDALAVGIAGTSFCVAAHLRARRVVRERLAGDERLIGRLQALAAESGEPMRGVDDPDEGGMEDRETRGAS